MRVMGARDPRFPNDADRLARLAAFPEQNPNPVVELDDRGLVYANPAALELFPDLPESGGEHPLISGSRRIASELRRAGAGSGSGEVELGETCYHLEIQLVPETGGLRAYAADVTQRREAERLDAEPSDWGVPDGAAGSEEYGPCVSCEQQQRGSEFLRKLNRGDETPGRISYSVIATRYDEVIVPYELSFLDGSPRRLTSNITL